jgi:putative glutamine amidotransferase
MHGSRPIIGVTFSARVSNDEATRRAASAYLGALEEHGAEVVEMLPDGEAPAVEGLDGLLLAGGVDVDPSLYGDPPHSRLGRVERDRDDLELAAAREATARGVPILGICRGAQVLGVAFGGRLYQDLPSDLGTTAHAAEGDAGARHWVRLAAGSQLKRILGADKVEVNSFHHQAISQVGEGWRAVAWAEGGAIEAVEGESGGFLIGVQWHPERMVEDKSSRRLFAAFVQAAQDYAATKGTRG